MKAGKAGHATPPQAAGPARPRRVKRDEVRRRILEAAGRMLLERGLEATSLEAVAEAAGFSKGAVYSNFGGKDELCFEALSAVIDARVSAAASAAAAPLGTEAIPSRRMGRVGDLIARTQALEPGWQVFFVELWLRCMRSPGLRARFAEKRRLQRRQIAAVLEAESAATSAPLPLPADQLAATILALSNGLGIEGLIDRSAVPPGLMGRVLAWTFKGMEAEWLEKHGGERTGRRPSVSEQGDGGR
jgi:AcrR family transcriptional regulator